MPNWRVGFWWIAGLVLLLPSSSVFPAADLSADRRLYLPLVAFGACAGLLLDKMKAPVWAVISVALAVLSFERTEVWRTEESLWTEAVERAPDKVRPKIQLARASEPGKARSLLEEAKRLAPGDARVATELGRNYLSAGDGAAALREFGRALALEPNQPRALNNRGVALLALGSKEAARQDFERALARDSCLFDARLNLHRLAVAAPPSEGCRYTPEQQKLLDGR